MTMRKDVHSSDTYRIRQEKLSHIKAFLIDHAYNIQKLATRLHKEFMGNKEFRSENIKKYQDLHVKIIKEIANNLGIRLLKRGSIIFEAIGESLAEEAVQDGLTIEETLDGTIFLKQAIWKSLEEDGLFELSTHEYHELNLVVGTYCDLVSSKIAFTYHKERQYIESNLRYLAEASKVLSSSLDYQSTLNTVALLAIPHIADWCTVDMLDDHGNLQQVAVVHKDHKKIEWAKELRKHQKVDMDAPTGLPNVLRTGKPELYSYISDKLLRKASKTETEYELAKSIGFTSAMIVPLFSRVKPIGAITYVTTETDRHYTAADLVVAEELAVRASVAIENARLYKGSQDAISIRDDFISVASHELKTPITSVKMFAQILKKHSEQIGDQKAVNYFSKMDKQLNRLTELIYDLLNVSKIQAGKMEFREEILDFDTVVTEIIDILQQSETKHTIKLKGSTHKRIIGDEERIGQVINNLVSNVNRHLKLPSTLTFQFTE